MISNAVARSPELRPSRPSIIMLHPPAARPALAPRAPIQARGGLLADLRDVLRMALGLDDEREDYECMR